MKNREIFEFLNDISTNYEDINLDREKISSIKKKFNVSKRENHAKKFAGLAAAVIILVSSIVLTNENVRAEIANLVDTFFTDERIELSKANNLPEDIKKYTVNLHESVTLSHMSFVIEDVAIDGKYGYLNLIYPEKYSIRYQEKNDYIYIVDKIYINGVRYFVNLSSSNEEKIGNGLISDVREFKLDKYIPAGDIKLGIEFAEFFNDEDRALVELNISMKELSKDTKVYLEDFSVPKAEEYTISKMLVNLFKPRIETVEPSAKNIYEQNRFIGEDKEGRKIVFEHDNSSSREDKMMDAEYVFVPKNDDWHEYKSDFTLDEFYKFKGEITFQMYKDIYDTTIFGERKQDQQGNFIYHTEKIGDSFTLEIK